MAAECGEFTIEEITIAGTVCRLRDFAARDIEPYGFWQAPAHSWHDTNGPYFGRPTALDGQRQTDRLGELVARDTLPVPRERLAVVDLSDRLIGTVTWYWESEETGWRRMGIVLFDPGARGRGIGREALALWTTYLFEATEARRLDFATYSGNTAMCAVGERLGFTLEARFREARAWNGRVHDGLVYGILRRDWHSSAMAPSGSEGATAAVR